MASYNNQSAKIAAGAAIVLGLGVCAYLYFVTRKRTFPKSGSSTGKPDLAGKREIPDQSKTRKQDVTGDAPSASEEVSPIKRSLDLKEKGNGYYKAKKYEEATRCYTEAIEACPLDETKNLSVFYQNRAAANEMLENHIEVIADCTAALAYDDHYLKAFTRRAKAHLCMGQEKEALNDSLCAFVLSGYKNTEACKIFSSAVESQAKKMAKDFMMTREPIVPSKHFVNTYLSAFPSDPVMNSISKYRGDGQAKRTPFEELACQLLRNEYDHVVELCSEEIERADSAVVPEALLVRGTFYVMMGQHDKAKSDMDELLNRKDVAPRVRSTALIRRAALYIQKFSEQDAMNAFTEAIEIDPSNGDIFHHRGQINMLLERLDEALKDMEKAIELTNSNVICVVQKTYLEFKYAIMTQNVQQVQACLSSLEKLAEKHPDNMEPVLLLAQALIESRMFPQADELYLKAIAANPDNASLHVQRATLYASWKNDMKTCEEMLLKAREIDNKSEVVHETLGTVFMSTGRLDEALESFKKAAAFTKTEIELYHIFSMLVAAEAQKYAKDTMGIQMPNLVEEMMNSQ